MYHPQKNADAEFIEILNIGSRFVDLTGLRLAGGAFVVFSRGNKPSLSPGERVLVVKDKAAMEAVYDASVLASVAGEFQYETLTYQAWWTGQGCFRVGAHASRTRRAVIRLRWQFVNETMRTGHCFKGNIRDSLRQVPQASNAAHGNTKLSRSAFSLHPKA